MPKKSKARKAHHAKPASDEQPKENLGKKERLLILKAFTKDVLKKYGQLIRSIVLFGSTARNEFLGESDIDIFIIIDDTRHKITPTMKEKMEEDFDVIAKKCSKQMSVQQPYLLTEFWRMVREGHPIIFNFIREGVPVYDKDVFLPIKRLLQMGEIRPSKEAVEKYIERGPKRIRRVENAKIYMVVEDCYYAMLESAQAVLMFLGKSPPRPGDAPEMLRKTLIPMKLLDEKTIAYLEGVIEIRKRVEHKNVKKISGQEIDDWLKKTRVFVKKMQDMIVKIEVMKRESMIEKSYVIMSDTAMTLLKALNKAPKKRTLLKAAIEAHLVKTGMIDRKYLDVFGELEGMKKIVAKGKVLDIQKQDILMNREYVRKFIRETGRVLKKKIQVDNGDEVGE
jgi:uncharacterized protein (UPF0332 family)/predicted nucleotidyltransferase